MNSFDNSSTECPCVSIIIPVYNDVDRLKSCLEALSAQTYCLQQVEVIIVDNGSFPEVTLDNNFPFRMRLIRHLVPGSYAARNEGVMVASGRVIAFTDADCAPLPDWVENGLAALEAGASERIVGGEVEITEPKVRTAVALYQYTTGFQQQQNVEKRGFAATANVFCTAEQFRTVGPFDERLLSGGDLEWAWRAFQLGIKLHFEPSAVVRTHPRLDLPSAIRQARRVAAGRKMLRLLGLEHLPIRAIERHRSAWSSLCWLMSQPSLTSLERLKVLWVAFIVRGASVLENVRLALGARPERR